MKNNGLTKEQLIVHDMLQNNLSYFCKKALFIKPKRGAISPFIFNETQVYIHRRLEEQKRKKGRVRSIVVKGRQMGASTLIGARFFHQATRGTGKNVFILAHESSSTSKLFDMTKRFYDYMPPALKPALKASNSRGLIFKDLDSQFILGTAGNADIGRGGTVNLLHGCLSYDTLVYLADGTKKPMRKMKKGDLVITSSGAVAPVKRLIRTGEKQLYRIEVFKCDESIEASADHKIMTLKGYKQVKELTLDDWILQSYPNDGTCYDTIKFSIKEARESISDRQLVSPREIELDKDAADFFSAFYICGRTRKQSNYTSNDIDRYGSIVFITNDLSEDHIESLRRFSAKYDANYKEVLRVIKLNMIVYSTYLSEFFRFYFTAQEDDREIVLPYWLFSAPEEFLTQFTNRLAEHGESDEIVNSIKARHRKVTAITTTNIERSLDLEVKHKDHNFQTSIGVVSNSEVAYWKNEQGMRSGLMQSVPKEDGTEIILESTANGIGGMFHRMAVEALEGKNEYQVIFAPWFWMHTYEADVSPDFIREDEEQEIAEAYFNHLPIEKQNRKLSWRRIVLSELGSIAKFRQEYPCSFPEAFQASGNSMIKASDIIKARKCTETDRDAPIIIGVDPARNIDRTCVAIRQGRHLIEYFIYEDMDSMNLSSIVANLIDKYKPILTCVDVGTGYGTVDRLIERGYKGITGVHFGSRANEPEVYRNRRAEMWVTMANWFTGYNINIPDKDDIHSDLMSMPEYQQTSDGTIKLISKDVIRKNYGKSCDIADAVALTFSTPYRVNMEKVIFKSANDGQSSW